MFEGVVVQGGWGTSSLYRKTMRNVWGTTDGPMKGHGGCVDGGGVMVVENYVVVKSWGISGVCGRIVGCDWRCRGIGYKVGWFSYRVGK